MSGSRDPTVCKCGTTPHGVRSWLSQELAGARVVVVDGGLASELEARGADLSSNLWSAALLSTTEGAALVRDTHLSYFEAGARVAITATYQVRA